MEHPTDPYREPPVVKDTRPAVHAFLLGTTVACGYFTLFASYYCWLALYSYGFTWVVVVGLMVLVGAFLASRCFRSRRLSVGASIVYMLVVGGTIANLSQSYYR